MILESATGRIGALSIKTKIVRLLPPFQAPGEDSIRKQLGIEPLCSLSRENHRQIGYHSLSDHFAILRPPFEQGAQSGIVG